MNSNTIIVFDFETLGLNTDIHEPIQLAALAINPRTLQPYSKNEGGEFSSLMRPPGDRKDWIWEQKALDVNKKNLDDIEQAPPQEIVWKEFCSFCTKYNPKNKPWTAPIPAGHNICGFDLWIIQRLAETYGPLDKVDGRPMLFNPKCRIDTTDASFMWFENTNEPENLRLDTLREFFGISKEGAHDALIDVKHCALLVCKYIELCRNLSPRVKFKGAFTK